MRRRGREDSLSKQWQGRREGRSSTRVANLQGVVITNRDGAAIRESELRRLCRVISDVITRDRERGLKSVLGEGSTFVEPRYRINELAISMPPIVECLRHDIPSRPISHPSHCA